MRQNRNSRTTGVSSRGSHRAHLPFNCWESMPALPASTEAAGLDARRRGPTGEPWVSPCLEAFAGAEHAGDALQEAPGQVGVFLDQGAEVPGDQDMCLDVALGGDGCRP